MKHKQVLLFLCATAVCYHLSMPVMAQDNNLIQQDDVIYQEMQSIENEESTEEGGFKETISEQGIQEVSDFSETEITQAAQSASNFSETEVTQGTQIISEVSNESIISDGWQQDEYGYYHYYQNGYECKSRIVEIMDSNGEMHGYYFDYDGRLFDDVLTSSYVSFQMDDGTYYMTGCIGTDENGYLIKGWDDTRQYYYDENYIRCENQIIEENGNLYYLGQGGKLCTNTSVVISGDLYFSDANGVLTSNDMTGKTEWVKANECWYLYVNGELVKDQLYTQGENTYYFDEAGRMQTGVFGYYEREKGYRWRFADQNGVIQHENNWCLLDDDWYYINENGDVVCGMYYIINNQKYYFDDNGKMAIGVFDAYEYNETTECYEYCSHLANSSGVVQSNPGWSYQDNSWYYINENGILARDCFILDNNYYIDYSGQMQIGRFGVYNSDEQETQWYYAREDGLIFKNQWIKAGLVYYYAGENGILLEDQWLEDTYYFDGLGNMVIGFYEIEETIYNFDNNGRKVGSVEKNGWQLNDGTWYYYTPEGNLWNGWLYYNDAWYYLSNSRMATNSVIINTDGYRYYLDYDGKMISKQWKVLLNSTGAWVYADDEGRLVQDNWKFIDNKWYYFDHVSMVYDTVRTISSIPRLFNQDGEWVGDVLTKSSWIQTDSGKWYYINENGVVNTKNKKKINGQIYYFYDNGLLKTNMVEEDVWIDENGMIDKTDGWKTDGYDWVYILNGKAQSGFTTIEGKQYYFNPYWGCKMNIGIDSFWDDNGKKYYVFCDSNGVCQALKEGWMSVKKNDATIWYYIKNGKPVTEWFDNYYFYGTGVLATGLCSIAGNRYCFFDENGYLMKNGWVTDGDFWYYADSIGNLYTGERIIDGKTYFFSAMGHLMK